MRKTAKRMLILAGALLACFLPSPAAATITDNCEECHTDTNAPQQPGSGVLWRADCVSCHALGTDERIVTLSGGIRVPQVFHYDTKGDLAGGNFAYVADAMEVGPTGSRKGHDVVDLFPGDFTFPPGFIHKERIDQFRKITCAGVNGCHGIRNQLMAGPGGTLVPRVGMAALRGAHHANVDGRLNVADTLANSYRFLMGVKGLEHTYAPDQWQNVTPLIHNEYYGTRFDSREFRLCSNCHVGSTRPTLDSYITAPRNGMSGFCATCHSDFHANQTIGVLAFFRHPADYVIPSRGEYADYLFYELTAPVARPIVYEEPSNVVVPGRDLVMCLSCHVAHGSPFDGMLRFDPRTMVAGNAGKAAGKGCFACHTSKGRR